MSTSARDKSYLYVSKPCVLQNVPVRTVDIGVKEVAVGFVSTRLVQRAACRAGYAVALRVAHVGPPDAATVWAQELVSASAVLTWDTNANFCSE
jgi:hypothetical protein